MSVKVFIRKYLWLVILIGIALYFYLSRFSSGTINPSYRNFAVSDTSKVTSITISNDSLKLFINRTDKGWMLNNSFSTRSDAVRFLLNVITRLEVGSPLPHVVADSLKSEIKTKGVKVDIYEGNKKIKSYTLLSTKKLNLGTIGLLNNSRVAFTIQIPTYRGDVASLFVLEPDYWKSNKLFIADINQIASIDVEIPNKPEKSFSISIDDNGIHLKASYFDKEIERFDTLAAGRFIVGLTGLTFEKFISKASKEERAAILLSQPDQIFTITLTNKQKLVLKTYPIPVDEYRDEFGRTVKFDLNRLYISFNNDAIIAVSTYIVFDPVLKDLSSFRVKN